MKTKLKGFLTLFIALLVQISFAQERSVSKNFFAHINKNTAVSTTTICDIILLDVATPLCNIKNNKPNAAGISAVGALAPVNVGVKKYPIIPATISTIAFNKFACGAFILFFCKDNL